MRLVRATKRILDAKQPITPRLVERCLGLDRETISRRHGANVVGTNVSIPYTPGTFDIHCALARLADRYTPHLQFLPSPEAKSSIDTNALLDSLKRQYGRVRLRSTETGGAFVVYHSKHWSHRSVLYVFDHPGGSSGRLEFFGLVFTRLHGH